MTTRAAVTFALLAMGSWGIWAVFAKLATRSIAPTTAMIVSYATSVGVALGYVVVTRQDLALSGPGTAFALAAGVFSGAGAIAFYVGLDHGRAGIVTTIAALYFVVAAAIGVLALGESMDLRSAAGVGFAVVAVALLAR